MQRVTGENKKNLDGMENNQNDILFKLNRIKMNISVLLLFTNDRFNFNLIFMKL